MQILIEHLSRDYFTAFSNKNSSDLFRMFDEDVELVDWDINLCGRAAVIEHNQRLFDSVNQIKVTVELIAAYGLTGMAKILVEVDDIKLNVVDILTFNNLGKISKIEAYKQ